MADFFREKNNVPWLISQRISWLIRPAEHSPKPQPYERCLFPIQSDPGTIAKLGEALPRRLVPQPRLLKRGGKTLATPITACSFDRISHVYQS